MPTGGVTETSPVRERRATRGWRTSVLAHAEVIRSEVILAGAGGRYVVDPDTWTVTPGTASAADLRLARMVLEYADDAVWYATQRSWLWHWVSGGHNEGAWSRLHVAEELLVELLAPTRLASYVPQATYTCRRLVPSDPRRRAVERVAKLPARTTLAQPRYVRGLLRDAMRASTGRNDARFQRARSLRNLTIAMSTVLFVLAVVAVLTGWLSPRSLPMCLEKDPVTAVAEGTTQGQTDGPPPQVCPTDGSQPGSGDVALVALVGMAAASISAARALAGTTQRLGPYSPVPAQGALKIIMGALFAIAGVTLLRAGWVPGVDDVDTGAEILAWALLFGYGQQALTGLLDQRAEQALSREPAGTTGSSAPAADGAGDEADDGEVTGEADDVAPDVPEDGTGDDTTDGAGGDAAGGDATGGATGAGEAVAEAVDGANLRPDAPDSGAETADAEPDAGVAVDESEAMDLEGDAPPPPPVKPAKKPAKKPATRPGP